MEDKTNKEIGEMLAEETIRVSVMEMNATGKDRLEKKYWAFFHLGFVACMKLNGASEKDIDEVLEVTHQELENIERDS